MRNQILQFHCRVIRPAIDPLGHHMKAVGDPPRDFAGKFFHPRSPEQVERCCHDHLHCGLCNIGIGHLVACRFLRNRHLRHVGLFHKCCPVIGCSNGFSVMIGKIGKA